MFDCRVKVSSAFLEVKVDRNRTKILIDDDFRPGKYF